MFDASAYALLDHGETDHTAEAPPVTPVTDQAGTLSDSGPARMAMAACSLCTQTLGDCALTSAKAGVVSPAIALSVCNFMNRAARRALQRPASGSMPAYLAFILLGNGRPAIQRKADVLALAETMR